MMETLEIVSWIFAFVLGVPISGAAAFIFWRGSNAWAAGIVWIFTGMLYYATAIGVFIGKYFL